MGLYNSRAWPALAADAATGAYDALLHVGDLAYDLAGLQVGVNGLERFSCLGGWCWLVAAPGPGRWLLLDQGCPQGRRFRPAGHHWLPAAPCASH